MMDVYYVSGVLLLMPLLESLRRLLGRIAGKGEGADRRAFFLGNVIFAVALVAAFLPTLVTKQIIYGSYVKSGYEHLWVWTSPSLLKAVLFRRPRAF